MPQEIKDEVVACGCTFSEHQDLEQVVAGARQLDQVRMLKQSVRELLVL